MAPERPAEETRVHTRLLNLALGIEESRAYWANVNPSAPAATRGANAFEERWFGAKSERRVKVLLTNLRARYDAYPQALRTLHRWPDMAPAARRVLCHWHTQLADPMYRRFTGEFLVRRRDAATPAFDRDVVIRWVNTTYADRWGAATVVQFASKLLSAASEAGLTTPMRDPRTLLYPRVPDLALGYLLYLLRGVELAGALTDNPYLASVGLDRAAATQRLRAVPGLAYQRMGDLDDFGWRFPTLDAWGEAML